MDTERRRVIETLGARVRARRTERLMTQAGLATEAGVSRDMVARLETGKGLPYPENIKKIAGVLGIDPEELMAGVGLVEMTAERTGTTADGSVTVSAMSRPDRGFSEDYTERIGRAYGIIESITIGELVGGIENLSDERRDALDVVSSSRLPDDSSLDSAERLPEGRDASTYVVEKRP